MQSKKSSKKTTTAADQSGAPVELNAAETSASKPRARSSKPKSENGEAAPAKRHRKAQSTPVAAETSYAAETAVSADVPASAPVFVEAESRISVQEDDIRRLAYHFWIERGQPHGSHHEDWFRAERELGVSA